MDSLTQMFLYSLGSRLYTMQEKCTESSMNGKYKKSLYNSKLGKIKFLHWEGDLIKTLEWRERLCKQNGSHDPIYTEALIAWLLPKDFSD